MALLNNQRVYVCRISPSWPLVIPPVESLKRLKASMSSSCEIDDAPKAQRIQREWPKNQPEWRNFMGQSMGKTWEHIWNIWEHIMINTIHGSWYVLIHTYFRQFNDKTVVANLHWSRNTSTFILVCLKVGAPKPRHVSHLNLRKPRIA
jgi:hypothetical protein